MRRDHRHPSSPKQKPAATEFVALRRKRERKSETVGS